MKQIEPLTEAVNDAAKNDPIAKLLMSVPGIGVIVAMTIVAEVGDISRFRSYRNLASYAGLVPSLDASGGKQRIGSITKISGGYKKAIVATAHKLLKIVYYVWKNQTPYQETYPVCA